MRVLFVINSLGAGGTERSLAEMVAPLADLGVECSFLCLESRPGVEEEVRMAGTVVAVLGTLSPARAVAGIRSRIRAIRPDIVQSALFEADVFTRLATVGAGVAVMGSLVNGSYEPVRLADPNVTSWKLDATRRIDGWTGRHLVDHFHAVSRFARDSAERHLGIDSSRITVVERGRDVRRLGEPSLARRHRVRQEQGIDPERLVIVSVGRHEFQKDQVSLLRSLRRLQHRNDWIALVAGRTGNATGQLEHELETSPVRDRVRLLGQRDDLPDVLAAADLFVCTSRFEGIPGAMIEAMAMALPVVSTDIPPAFEVVEPGVSAELFPIGDVETLARHIDALLDDGERRHQMGRRGRRIFCERFTLEHSAARMAELYRQVKSGEVA